MKPVVLIPHAVAPRGHQWLLEQGCEVRTTADLEEATLLGAIVDCDALLVRNFKVTRRLMEAGARLKVVARHGVGLDNVDLQAATELGVWVTNAPIANSETVAEHTLGLILALAHRMVLQDRELRGGNFEARNQFIGTDVAGKTLGLVGLGNISTLVAQKAALGLNMKVLAYTRTPRLVPEWIELVTEREKLFSRSDFVSLHVPLTAETHHSVGRRELFEWMKPSAYLVNTARGEVVDETVLIQALQERRIAGAALDTFENEPPSRDNPLFAMDNVVVTPHSAALTVESMERMALHAGEGIVDVLSGRRPQWPVNEPARPRQPAG